jgi:hypothetical protein
MVFEIEWLRGAQRELDAEIEYVLGRFGFGAARKTYRRIMSNSLPHSPISESNMKVQHTKVVKFERLPFDKLPFFILLSQTR